MRLDDTIAAIATPPGRSARALVRLSGPACPDIAQENFAGEIATGTSGPARFILGSVRSDRRGVAATTAVACLLTMRPAPASYTGEDTIEMLLPGHPGLLARILARLTQRPDVRLAEPGEFSARAYLNGRMSLTEAEGVAMTIAAQNEQELHAARRTLRGESGRNSLEISDALAGALALVEAGIDFADEEDVVSIAPADLLARLRSIEKKISIEVGAEARRARSERPRFVLIGHPNAGKSTLLNALLGRRRAVVSSAIGTTRDAIEAELDLSDVYPGAGVVDLIDIAGLDDSPSIHDDDRHASHAATADEAAREAALREIQRADALILCAPDGRFPHLPTPDERPVIRVRTKADLPGTERADDGIAVCALDGWNLPSLERAIADAANAASGECLLAPRHTEAYRLALDRIESARRCVDAGPADRLRDAELIAQDLRLALDAVCSITGRMTPDDVIGRIFATFCIGK